MKADMINLILLGPPGAGKGTQSDLLKEKYGLTHLSTGDIFRSELKNNTPKGQEAKAYLDRGELVPDSIVVDMVAAQMDLLRSANGYIFDGFPRTEGQAEALDNLLHERGMQLNFVLVLEVPDEELRIRLRHRALSSGRSDDANPSVIENRIVVYKQETFPLIQYYKSKGKVSTVNGIGEISAIYNTLCRIIEGN
jgi:adenylate kinase